MSTTWLPTPLEPPQAESTVTHVTISVCTYLAIDEAFMVVGV